MEKTILFDLDGTLTASGIGITKCVQYALEKMGHPENDLKKLEIFIGPPLITQFMEYLNISKEEAEQAVVYYRERYTTVGIFENELYPNVEKMLKTLKDNNYTLAVSSSKPEKFVKQILEHFKIKQYFDEVVGATMSEKRTDKAEVIEETLKRLGRISCSNNDTDYTSIENSISVEKEKTINTENIIMVGDKKHDILGARQFGIPCVAVSYGYGTMEELTNENPHKIVNTVDELLDYLLNN